MTGGELVREARLRVGISQAELGRRLGVPQSTVARWERGAARPAYDSVVAAIRACGLDLSIAVVPYDDSIDDLIDAHLRMSPEQRLAQNTHAVNFLQEARRRMADARQ
jgi:transcriptional regulator with XRE-family HTH domain